MTGRQFDCTFCEILAGTRAARVVFEDDDTLAFLDRAPANPGHTLVVPRAHVIDLLDASPEQTASVARAAQQVARLQLDRLAADGVTLFQANRAAGWQDVFHLHVHVVPRYDGDKLQRQWTSNVADPAELQAAHDKLTSCTIRGSSERNSCPLAVVSHSSRRGGSRPSPVPGRALLAWSQWVT